MQQEKSPTRKKVEHKKSTTRKKEQRENSAKMMQRKWGFTAVRFDG